MRQYLIYLIYNALSQVETLVRDMDNIYIKSIQAVQKIMINDKHCFELYPLSITDYSIL